MESRETTSSSILLITMGGEINSSPEAKVYLEEGEENLAANYIQERIKPDFPMRHEPIAPNDFAAALTNIQKAEETQILLTIGRDQIQNLGQFLFEHQSEIADKTVVLTSSKRTFHSITDARFNLGFGIAVAKGLSPDIVIVDAGKIYSPLNIRQQGANFVEVDRTSPYAINLQAVDLLMEGGTIVGRPDMVRDGQVVEGSNEIMARFLKFLELQIELTVHDVTSKDSRDLTYHESNRQFTTVREEVRSSVVLATIGTYELARFARNLKRRLEELPLDDPLRQKFYLYLGAWTPLKDYIESDGDFNLGYALGAAAVQSEIHDEVNIAMHAQIFDPSHTLKDRDQEKFVTQNHIYSWVDDPAPSDYQRKPNEEEVARILRGELSGFENVDPEALKEARPVGEHASLTQIGLTLALKLKMDPSVHADTKTLLLEACAIAKVIRPRFIEAVCFEGTEKYGGGIRNGLYLIGANHSQFLPGRTLDQ